MRSRKTATTFPLARKEGLLVERIDDETVVFDLTTNQAHCLKPLASLVHEHADGETSVDVLAERATARFGRPIAPAEVLEAVELLEDNGILEGPLVIHNGGISRRDALKTAGAVAASATLLSTILAPTAALAASGIASGCSGCGQNKDCVSNHCCQGVPGKQCNQGCCVGANNSCHFCGCVNGNCNCTVTPSDLDQPSCPCICGTPGCVNVPCCPQGQLCCTNSLPTGCV
jgi:hypothetical protein